MTTLAPLLPRPAELDAASWRVREQFIRGQVKAHDPQVVRWYVGALDGDREALWRLALEADAARANAPLVAQARRRIPPRVDLTPFRTEKEARWTDDQLYAAAAEVAQAQRAGLRVEDIGNAPVVAAYRAYRRIISRQEKAARRVAPPQRRPPEFDLGPWRTPAEERWTDRQLRDAHLAKNRREVLTAEQEAAARAYQRLAARARRAG